MKIETDKNGDIILKEVFSGVGFETADGETFGICMRDSGFEFNYNGVWYSAQQGKITKMCCKSQNKEEDLKTNPAEVSRPDMGHPLRSNCPDCDHNGYNCRC